MEWEVACAAEAEHIYGNAMYPVMDASNAPSSPTFAHPREQDVYYLLSNGWAVTGASPGPRWDHAMLGPGSPTTLRLDDAVEKQALETASKMFAKRSVKPAAPVKTELPNVDYHACNYDLTEPEGRTAYLKYKGWTQNPDYPLFWRLVDRKTAWYVAADAIAFEHAERSGK